jgi:protein-L-isoaspartate(D-aspartate) O-methyltransferase
VIASSKPKDLPGDKTGIGMTSARTRERLVERLRQKGIRNEAVLARIRDVPRHVFVDEALATRAYEDDALPIGLGQTISQPFVVARMTEALLEKTPPRKVLEIGSGCGYQTAVLAPLVAFVYSVERIGTLLDRARKTCNTLGLKNVQFRHGDGFKGWSGHAPYDGILMAAAPEQIPEALLKQLAIGGRLVAPVGGQSGSQQLVRITRRNHDFVTENLGLVHFVPMLKGLG